MTPWNGLGSTFSIILALPLFKQSENSPLVLAVDDHPINRDLLARQIKLLGLRVRTAENVAVKRYKYGVTVILR